MTDDDAELLAEKTAEKLAAILARPTLAQMAAAAGAGSWSCPRCGCEDWRTTDSRWGGNGQRRQRVCRNCRHVLHTIELPVE